MADQPRKDLKTAPTLRDVTSGAKQASPLPPTDGASLDAFNTLAPVSAAGAAAEAKQVEEAARARQEPALSQFPRGSEPNSEPGSSQAASSVAGAASAAEVVREAARQRIEPAVSRDFTEQQPRVTEEAPASYADRIGVNVGEMLERLNPDVVGREAGIGEGQEAPAAFRDSGRDALAAQVDAAFDLGGDTGTQGRTPGRMGTPADLGVTGDFGTKAGLNAGSSAGMDLFDVGLPNRGVSGAANDLGLMQGIISDMTATDLGPNVAIGANDEGAPPPRGVKQPPTKVTEIDTVPDGAPIEPVPDGKPIEPSIVVEEALRTAAQAIEAAAPYVLGALAVAAAGAAAAASAPALGAALAGGAAAAALGISGSGEDAGEGKVPDATDPGREGSGIIAPPTAAEMAVRAAARERLGLGSPGSGDVDPADNAEDVPGGPPPTMLQAGLQQKAMRDFLFGQPAGPEAGVGGSGSIDFGRLPGDMGNIDYGPDSTGAWTGNSRTESEADALGSFGGSGLSISDANRNDDDDDQDDSDDSN